MIHGDISSRGHRGVADVNYEMTHLRAACAGKGWGVFRAGEA